MGKRELLLIVGFLVIGTIVYSVTAPPPGPNERGLSLSRFINEIRREIRGNPGKAEVTTTATHEIAAETTEIVVRDAFSQVQITGEERSDIETTTRVTSNGENDEQARELATRTTLKIDRPGPAVTFAPDAPEEGRQSLFLTMKVPSRMRVRIETPSSRVSIANVAAVEVTSGRTETTVRKIPGRVTISHRGGTLQVEEVASLKLTTRNSEATVANVSGDTSISVQGGEMKVAGLAGAVDLEAQNADVVFERAEQMKGPVRFNAVGGSLAVRGLKADTRIDGRNAEIAVEMAGSAPLVIYSTGDDTTEVTLPTGAFSIDAVAVGGRIAPDVLKDLGVGVTAGEDSKEERASGAVRGGGPSITVRATGGDIRFAKRGAAQ